MLTNLLNFSDFFRKKIFESNSSQTSLFLTQNNVFSKHYLQRSAGFNHPEVKKKISRLVPEDNDNVDGFVLTQNLLDEDGNIIQNKTLDTILQNFSWDYKNLTNELSQILSELARSVQVEQFLIQAISNQTLEDEWVMFLVNVCLLKSGDKFYLDFRSSKFHYHTGGSLWGAGDKSGANTILIFKKGKNGDSAYDQVIKTEVAKSSIPKKYGVSIPKQLTQSQINKVQILYPFGENFTIDIDLDLTPSQINNSITNQISSAQSVTPVLNKPLVVVDDEDFVPEDIFDFFSRGDIWFSNDNLYFRNEKVFDILGAIERGEIKKWETNKKEYSITKNTNFIFTAKEQSEIETRLKDLFFYFHSGNSEYSSIQNKNLEDQNFKTSFQNLKSNFDNFKKRFAPSEFKKINRDMIKNLESLEEGETKILSFSEFLAEKKILKRGNNPCWPGYRQVGLKTKNGRSVPNCVPVKN